VSNKILLAVKGQVIFMQKFTLLKGKEFLVLHITTYALFFIIFAFLIWYPIAKSIFNYVMDNIVTKIWHIGNDEAE
jgi:hypothetical protein